MKKRTTKIRTTRHTIQWQRNVYMNEIRERNDMMRYMGTSNPSVCVAREKIDTVIQSGRGGAGAEKSYSHIYVVRYSNRNSIMWCVPS